MPKATEMTDSTPEEGNDLSNEFADLANTDLSEDADSQAAVAPEVDPDTGDAPVSGEAEGEPEAEGEEQSSSEEGEEDAEGEPEAEAEGEQESVSEPEAEAVAEPEPVQQQPAEQTPEEREKAVREYVASLEKQFAVPADLLGDDIDPEEPLVQLLPKMLARAHMALIGQVNNMLPVAIASVVERRQSATESTNRFLEAWPELKGVYSDPKNEGRIRSLRDGYMRGMQPKNEEQYNKEFGAILMAAFQVKPQAQQSDTVVADKSQKAKRKASKPFKPSGGRSVVENAPENEYSLMALSDIDEDK